MLAYIEGKRRKARKPVYTMRNLIKNR